MNDSATNLSRRQTSAPDKAGKVPACVYMLADHLDAALAAGEDLMAVAKTWERGNPIDPGVAGMQRWTLSRVRTHEMQFLHRVSMARERARELHGVDTTFRPLVHLFVAGTEPLAVATAEYCDPTLAAFETGDAETAYLRSRGLIAEEAPGLAIDAELEINEHFLIGGRARLGITMDLIAEFLDALDIKFDLYPPEGSPMSDGTASAIILSQDSAELPDSAPVETA